MTAALLAKLALCLPAVCTSPTMTAERAERFAIQTMPGNMVKCPVVTPRRAVCIVKDRWVEDGVEYRTRWTIYMEIRNGRVRLA